MFRIAVDFDGTLCEDNWPDIGEPNGTLISWLIGKKEQSDDVVLILWTLREDTEHVPLLTNAIEWCKKQGLEFDLVNEAVQVEGYDYIPRKFPCEMYIDDRALNPITASFVVPNTEIMCSSSYEAMCDRMCNLVVALEDNYSRLRRRRCSTALARYNVMKSESKAIKGLTNG